MPDHPAVVDFEDENAQNGAKALEFTRTLTLEWSPDEVDFWFTQLENEMYTCEVKSQWLKRCVLVKNLPPKVQADVKSLLTLKQSEAPVDIYKQIKTEILRIHAPEEEDNYKKALSLVLTGLPSQLGQQLVSKVCGKSSKLSCGCCVKAVKTLWTMQLPAAVRAHVADMKFDKDTYQKVFQSADKVFLSQRSADLAPQVAAIVKVPEESGSAATGEVAAIRQSRGGGRNRGNRNNRNSGGNSGGAGKNSNEGNQSSTQSNDTRKRHKSNPSPKCCDNHYRWADQAWFCLSPLTCPLANKCAPRPPKNNNN